MFVRNQGVFLLAAVACLFSVRIALAQPAVPNEPTVQLNFPQEVEIQVLIDYVSNRLGIKFLYDDQVRSKRISIKSPGQVPTSSVLAVLESALRMKGLVLADADAPGWKRIVQAEQMVQVAEQLGDDVRPGGRGNAEAVTQLFRLTYVDPQKLDLAIKPLLTTPGANSILMPESRSLIVTDYAANLVRISQLIELLDRPKPTAGMEIIKVQYVDADTLTKQVTGILAARGKAEGRLESIVEIVPDGRSNQLIVIGSAAAIQDTKAIIKQFDVPLGLTTKAYSFEHVSANRIDSLMLDLLGEETTERLYRSSVDDEENLLVVTTTKDIHQQIEQIKKSRDIRPKRGRSPMRFYKVKNVPVRDLLQTIRSIEQQTSAVQSNQQEFATPILLNPRDGSFTIAEQPGVLPSNGPQTPSGPNQPPAEPGFELPPPPSYRGAESQPPLIEQGTSLPSVGAASLLGKARITADVHTNTLIVIAEPQVQRLYEELIQQLDQPLPQVLIESHIVIIDTTDDFSLGVEFSTGDRDGSRRTLTFSSFGLSEVDPVSGALSIIPGLGFNGTLVDPDVADVVVRALTDHSRSRVTSAPRILPATVIV